MAAMPGMLFRLVFTLDITSATLTMVVVGTINGWTTISLHYLIAATGSAPLSLTHDQYSWIVSLTIVGSMIGALVAAHLADRSGRKQCLLVCSTMFTIGWFVIYEATSVPMLYLARLILGIGVGIAHTINPMYVSEVANRNLRGALGILIAVNVLNGSLLTCTLGLFLTYKSLLTVLVIISFISLFSNTCFPETPYFLLAKGRTQQARKSIAYYRGIADSHRVGFELHPLCPQTRHELHQQSTSEILSESRSDLLSESRSELLPKSRSNLPSQSRSNLPSQSRGNLPAQYRSNLPSQSTCEAHSAPMREVGTEATSDLHLPSNSDSHAQSGSVTHSEDLCEVLQQATGELRVKYSRDSHGLPLQTSRELHSQTTSDLHRPSTSEIHPEITSEIQPEATSEIHPETTNEIHRPSTSEVHRPSTSEIQPEPTSEVQPEPTSKIQPQPTSEIQPEPTSEIQPEPTSEIQPQPTSEIRPEPTSEIQPEPTSEIRPQPTSEIRPQPTSEIQPEPTSQMHRPSSSEIHSDHSHEILSRRTCGILSRSNENLREWADIDEIHIDFTKYNWSTKLRAILQRSNRKALFIMLGLTMAQHLSGNYITTQYLKVLFNKTAIVLNPYKASLMIHILSILSGGFTIATVEYLGRRTLLIMSTLGTCCPLIILANYLLLVEHEFDVSITSIPISNLVVHQVLFQIGLGTLPNVLRCELFPAELRAFVGAIIVIFDGIVGFTVSKLYQVITNNIGSYANYMIFATSCCLAFMMVIIWIPETKGKTYREIEALLVGENLNSSNEEVRTDEMDIRRI